MNYESLENMVPVIYHARVQAKLEKGSRSIGKDTIKLQNKNWEKNEIFHRFLRIYEEFVHDFILPQFQEYGGILYQAIPTLRVVFPGSVAPVKPHKDADYWHDSNEINYWVPLVPVAGSNSLWSESEPGKGFLPFSHFGLTNLIGDFHSFDLDGSAGELMRFYGNRCQHYTTENSSTTCRVSFDFRVIPASLFRLNSRAQLPTGELSRESFDPLEESSSPSESSQPTHSSYIDDESLKKLALRGAKPLLEGKYYSRMMISES
jgi:hypothetical protein